MSAPSDRTLLRWLPLVVVVAVAVTVGLVAVSRPYAGQQWPRPKQAPVLERVIDLPRPSARG